MYFYWKAPVSPGLDQTKILNRGFAWMKLNISLKPAFLEACWGKSPFPLIFCPPATKPKYDRLSAARELKRGRGTYLWTHFWNIFVKYLSRLTKTKTRVWLYYTYTDTPQECLKISINTTIIKYNNKYIPRDSYCSILLLFIRGPAPLPRSALFIIQSVERKLDFKEKVFPQHSSAANVSKQIEDCSWDCETQPLCGGTQTIASAWKAPLCRGAISLHNITARLWKVCWL